MKTLRKTNNYELALGRNLSDELRVLIIENQTNNTFSTSYSEGFELIKDMLVVSDSKFDEISKNKIDSIFNLEIA
jgi:hypothetical protein